MSGANYIILSSQLSCQVTLGALHAPGRSYRKSWNEVEWRPPDPAATLTNTKQSDNIAILHYLSSPQSMSMSHIHTYVFIPILDYTSPHLTVSSILFLLTVLFEIKYEIDHFYINISHLIFVFIYSKPQF